MYHTIEIGRAIKPGFVFMLQLKQHQAILATQYSAQEKHQRFSLQHGIASTLSNQIAVYLAHLLRYPPAPLSHQQ